MARKAKRNMRRKVFWRLKAEKSGPCTLHCFGNIHVDSDSFLLLNLHGHCWKIQMSMDDDRNFHCCFSKKINSWLLYQNKLFLFLKYLIYLSCENNINAQTFFQSYL